MRPADRLAALSVVAIVAAGGCMKIYPDPELPDIEVTWFDSDCREGVGDVVLALLGLDDPAFRADLVVPCSAGEARFVDLARERFRLQSELRSSAGDTFARYDVDIDLRNGLDQREELYLGGFGNVRVAWTFDMDASCASLAADAVGIELAAAELPEPYAVYLPCDAPSLIISMPDGLYTATVRATSNRTTVAISSPSPQLPVSVDTFTDFGTLVMTPCGSSCPGSGP